MKEEIEFAKQILDEMTEAVENEDFESAGGKANIVKTVMESIELSGAAFGLAEDSQIEPCDPEDDLEEDGEVEECE
ncbi:MAG: hypothetical protein WCQ65_12205 [Fermentimonas sp.]